jgi:hypothetical protein
MVSLEALITPLTREQAKASIYAVLAAVGVNTTTWKSGAVVRTIIAALAIIVAAFSALVANLARSGFLDYSTGDWLTLLARYVYGVERLTSTQGTGTITLINTGGGVFTLDPGDLVVKHATTNKTYTNTATISLGAFATLTDVPVIAVELGTASNANPGTITTFESSLLGVTVTNTTAVVGTDDESDPLLRVRCREKLGSLSPNGPWDAYAYVAKTAKRADGSLIGVTRVHSKKDGYGNVYVYCATATGGVTGDNTDPDTDLGAIALQIQKSAEPLGVTSHTLSAVAKSVNLVYQVWLYNTSGLTDAQVQALIATELTRYASAAPIGGNVIGADPGKIFRTDLEAVMRVRPEIFRINVVIAGADGSGDLVFADNEAPVYGGSIGTITQIAPKDGVLL